MGLVDSLWVYLLQFGACVQVFAISPAISSIQRQVFGYPAKGLETRPKRHAADSLITALNEQPPFLRQLIRRRVGAR